jgi:DNA repair protein RadC
MNTPDSHPPFSIREIHHPVYRSIADMRSEERPRERMKQSGASALTDAELLAIILKTGAKHFSALEVAKLLLDQYGSLAGIASRDAGELKPLRGMGEVKTLTLMAAFEIARRVQAEPFRKEESITSAEQCAKMLIPRLRGERVESFRALLLNAANQIIREVVITQGILNASLVHPREVFRLAITESAASMIVVHNHPSGNPAPSQQDIAITKQLCGAGVIMDIAVIDHIIIAGETYSSLKELGLM